MQDNEPDEVIIMVPSCRQAAEEEPVVTVDEQQAQMAVHGSTQVYS